MWKAISDGFGWFVTVNGKMIEPHVKCMVKELYCGCLLPNWKEKNFTTYEKLIGNAYERKEGRMANNPKPGDQVTVNIPRLGGKVKAFVDATGALYVCTPLPSSVYKQTAQRAQQASKAVSEKK